MSSSGLTEKEVFNDFKENYAKVRKLLDEDSKNDPENEPYLSKYKAKNLLLEMCDSLGTASDKVSLDQIKVDAMLGVILLNIGIIDMETEELASSEMTLTQAVQTLSPNATRPEIVTTLINVYNNLGILWSNRDESEEKARAYLNQAKDLYETFKCSLQLPVPIEQVISDSGEVAVGDFIYLEKAYTLTLYYMAQVFGHLKNNLKSAIYFHATLRRQLQYSDYEPIDWGLNSATLSQFFAEQNGFHQSRHHLAAASTIFEEYEVKLRAMESEDDTYLAKLETFNHRSADVARCWVKYCLNLMLSSKTRLMVDEDKLSDAITDMSNLTLEDDENICGGNIKNLKFPDLDVSKFESKITDKFILTFEDAREVFLCCQEWLNKAKEYYKLDTLASDYIELVQDSSQCYSYLAFFEEDDDRRAKMHKRRIDMLEELVKEINPTYYLQYCRQLWFELGEAYSDVLNIKLEKVKSEKATPHALKKINTLCEKSIENYDIFLNSVKDKEGKMPEKLDIDMVRPVISALAFIGRNSMKRIAIDKCGQLDNVRKSYNSYQAVVDICSNDKEAAAVMPEEYSLCQEMVKILPVKINKLEAELKE